MYKIVNSIEKIDKEDLVLVTEEDKRARGHVKKVRMRQCVKVSRAIGARSKFTDDLVVTED
ncbi:hypothetical protein E2C01_009105 [Portunus trituberculatus]|uniref:Uncharacterized protein n=1 Tax=Portunus trituberculatus TaxID=210409 RepID=A0A5B7D571_PORTR|nr:hypothetical protein [Portunus trituberculatus]